MENIRTVNKIFKSPGLVGLAIGLFSAPLFMISDALGGANTSPATVSNRPKPNPCIQPAPLTQRIKKSIFNVFRSKNDHEKQVKPGDSNLTSIWEGLNNEEANREDTTGKQNSPQLKSKIARLLPKLSENTSQDEEQLVRQSSLSKALEIQQFLEKNQTKPVKTEDMPQFLKSLALYDEQLRRLLNQPHNGLNESEVSRLHKMRVSFVDLITAAFSLDPDHEDLKVARERQDFILKPDPDGKKTTRFLTPELRADLASVEMYKLNSILRQKSASKAEQDLLLNPRAKALDWIFQGDPTDLIVKPNARFEPPQTRADGSTGPATYSLFHHAMAEGSVAIVNKYFLQKQADFNVKDSSGKTPLQYFPGVMPYDFLDNLLTQDLPNDADARKKDLTYRRSFASAVLNKSIQDSRSIRESRSYRNPNFVLPAGRNNLIQEMQNPKNQFMAKLIQQGDLELFDTFSTLREFPQLLHQMKNPDGTPANVNALGLAAQNHHLEMFEKISRHAPKLLDDETTEDPPLRILSAEERNELKTLAQKNKNKDLIDRINQADRLALATQSTVTNKDALKNDPSNSNVAKMIQLQLAARRGDLNEVQKLIPVRQSKLQGFKKLIGISSKNSPKKYNWDDTEDKEGRSLMHLAVLSKNTALATWLMKTKGSSLVRLDHNGQTPLHTALLSGNLPLFKLMLDSPNPLNLYQKDTSGRTPLELLVKISPEPRFQALLNRKVTREEVSAAIASVKQ